MKNLARYIVRASFSQESPPWCDSITLWRLNYGPYQTQILAFLIAPFLCLLPVWFLPQYGVCHLTLTHKANLPVLLHRKSKFLSPVAEVLARWNQKYASAAQYEIDTNLSTPHQVADRINIETISGPSQFRFTTL